MSEARRLTDFAGRWRVSRRIVEANASVAQFEGDAMWSPKGDGLAYHEVGEMRLANGPVMQAERRYFWSDDLTVFFDDGRLFHQVPPLGGSVRHWCEPDDYQLRYDFETWPAFSVYWQVKGPRKDYRAETNYTRC